MPRYTSSSSDDPYGKPAAAAAASSSYGNSYGNSYGAAAATTTTTTTTTSSSAAISADDYDPYAKYDNNPSSSNASSGYGSSNASSGYGSSGYTSNSYGNTTSAGNTTVNDTSHVSADDYDPYAKYDNNSSAPSTATTATATATTSASSSYAPSSGYNSYGNTASTGNDTSQLSADGYDPYAKYGNNPSAPSIVAATTTATTTQSSHGASSGYGGYGGNAANSAPDTSSDDYDPYAQYGNAPSATPAATAAVATPSTRRDDGFSTGFHNGGGGTGPSSHHAPAQVGTVVGATQPQKQYVQVTLPNGVVSGQHIQVRSPDGRVKDVVVPPGMGPGSTYTVDFDAPSSSSSGYGGGGATTPFASSSSSSGSSQMNKITNKLNKLGIKIPGGMKIPGAMGATAVGAGASAAAYQQHAPVHAMGSLSSNASPSQLAPIAPQHATLQPTELFLKEKTMSWTGDDAKIKDASGNVVFQIKADMLTFNQSRTLVDASGTVLGVLKHKLMDFAPTIYIGTPNNEKKVKLKTTGMFNPLNCNASISIDGVEVGKVKGNWRAKKYSIKIGGVEIATVGRKTTMASLFMDADSYVISVQPKGQPVDLAFISLLAIGLDELYHDK